MMKKRGMVGWSIVAALVGMFVVGCGDDDATPGVDAGPGVDLGVAVDLGPADAGVLEDAGSADLGAPEDAGPADLGPPDLGPADLGPPDLGPRCAPRVSGDTRWAQYPMPGTPGHARSYQVTGAAGSETVIDCVTGLEWQRAVPTGTFTQAASAAYCDGLALGGYSDWRLPSRVELVTLVDYSAGRWVTMIDPIAFPGPSDAWFWSSSSFAGVPPDGWYVDFSGGYTNHVDVTGIFSVRCVR